jgi:hypothetical protein
MASSFVLGAKKPLNAQAKVRLKFLLTCGLARAKARLGALGQSG